MPHAIETKEAQYCVVGKRGDCFGLQYEELAMTAEGFGLFTMTIKGALIVLNDPYKTYMQDNRSLTR